MLAFSEDFLLFPPPPMKYAINIKHMNFILAFFNNLISDWARSFYLFQGTLCIKVMFMDLIRYFWRTVVSLIILCTYCIRISQAEQKWFYFFFKEQAIKYLETTVMNTQEAMELPNLNIKCFCRAFQTSESVLSAFLQH